jgi:SWI/SNF-related matrix-associated actin-dependent regulator of chromatin subfamily A3
VGVPSFLRASFVMAMLSAIPTARSCSGSTGESQRVSPTVALNKMAHDRGCVTPQILGNISSYGVERVAGFSSLQAEDQARVRLAVKRRRIDPADFTGSSSSSQPIPQPSQSTSTQAPAASTGKRRADTAPGPSQSHNVAMPSPTQAAARQAAVGGTAWEEGADAEEVVEEQIDELYCTVSSSVVGIQYYKGACLYCLIFSWACHDYLHGRPR